MENKIVKVIMWILFWWYLIPYYLFKKYVFRKDHQILYSALSSIIVLFILLFVIAVNSPDDSSSTKKDEAPTVHVVTKKVGSDKLKKSKAKQRILAAQKSEKQKEYDKLKDELDDKKQEQEQKQEEEKQQKQEQEEQAKQKAEQEQKAQERAQKNQTHEAPTNHGDLSTASTGTIVGNSRSHIYHVPGQADYRMNSANAVYFNSEQEAINAGYRKAKR